MDKIHDLVTSIDPSLKDFKQEYKELELGEVPDFDFSSMYKSRTNLVDFDGDVLECKNLDDLHRALKASGTINSKITNVTLFGTENSIRRFYSGEFIRNVGPVSLTYHISKDDIKIEGVRYLFVASNSYPADKVTVMATDRPNIIYSYTPFLNYVSQQGEQDEQETDKENA